MNYVWECQPKPKCAFHSGESREEMHISSVLSIIKTEKNPDFKNQKVFKLNKR